MQNVSDNNFDQHFRNHLGELNSTPSDRNWMAIEQQLPQTENKKVAWWWIWPALLLVGFTVGAVWYLDALEERNDWQSLPLSPAASFDPTVKADLLVMSRLLASQRDMDSRSPVSVIMSKPASVSAAVQPYSSVGVPQARQQDNAHAQLAATESFPFYLHPLQASLLTTQPFDRNPLFYDDNQQLRKHAPAGFRIGPIAMVQLTGMRGDAVRQPFADNQFDASRTAGTAYGLAMHYDLNSRWGITLETLISSSEGQRFAYVPVVNTLVPEQLSYHVATNYLRIPLLVKYRGEMMRGLSPNPILWNLQAGVAYGRLNWVNLDDAGQLIMPRSINSHELGVALGASADWYVGKNYIWTVGARITSSTATTSIGGLQGASGSWQGGLYTQFSWLLSNK